mgnify:CR=1 FL=1
MFPKDVADYFCSLQAQHIVSAILPEQLSVSALILLSLPVYTSDNCFFRCYLDIAESFIFNICFAI